MVIMVKNYIYHKEINVIVSPSIYIKYKILYNTHRQYCVTKIFLCGNL